MVFLKKKNNNNNNDNNNSINKILKYKYDI